MSPPPKRTIKPERGSEPPGARLPLEEHTMPTRKAVVVGVNNYGGPPNDLPSCVNDANTITQLLQSRYGFKEVHTVRDGDATVARLEEELKWLAKASKPDDRLVFYFSGHGYTKLADGIMEEFLVLTDGLFDDNRLVNETRDLAPGTLTVILDTSFSGGMEKKVFDPTAAVPNVELAQVKSWTPPREEAVRDKGLAESGHQTVREFRRFGGAPISSTAQLELNGLLLTSCLETETAVASTSKTEGLSAFTHALIRSAERLGPSASTVDVLAATEHHLMMLGVRQTPFVLERATPGNLRRRTFISLEATSVSENLGMLSEPRFWEGVLTAVAPQVHALRAVHAKEGELMSTMFQPTLPNYQGSFGGFQQGGYQPSFGFGQPTPEDVQRIIPVLGPVLATVIPAVVPPIVNSIFNQQKQLGFGGNYQQTSPEDVQKILPVLGPVLATVIPAILPPIINSIIVQQKQSMGGWGGQSLGVGNYGQQQPQFGWGSQQPTQDLTQTVAYSVNDALRRVGIQTQGARF